MTTAKLLELHVHTDKANKQAPPMQGLTGAVIEGPETKLVQIDYASCKVECLGHGADGNGVPYLLLQHEDDTQHVWETTVELPDLKGYLVWAVNARKDNLKIALVKGI